MDARRCVGAKLWVEFQAAHDTEQLLPAFWMVADENAIHAIKDEDLDGYEFVNMEISSRILQETEFDEVARVYNLIQSSIKTQVNSSCGLHYHIGINHLSLDSLKRLVTLLMVLETKDLFGMICAPYRATHPDKSSYSRPVHKHSRAAIHQESAERDSPNDELRVYLPPGFVVSPSFFLTLTRIWNCQSIRDIADELLTVGPSIAGTSSHLAFYMRGGFAIRTGTIEVDIDGSEVYADPTIEIRYRESTGSAAHDYPWLKLCLSLVRAAEWPQAQLQGAMAAICSTNTLAGLLQSVGIDEDEIQWWSGIAARYRQYPYPSKKTEFLAPESF